jgi:hypothetical protein
MTDWADTYAQAREIGKRVRRQRNKYSFDGHLQRWLSAGIGNAKQLAAVSGYCDSVICNIKNGQHSPSARVQADLIQAMGAVEREHIAKWQQGRKHESYRI